MNEAAIRKHEIYGKLGELSRQELKTVGDFIDFVRHKKRKSHKPRLVKLEGILKDHALDTDGLAELKANTWRHLDEEFAGE